MANVAEMVHRWLHLYNKLEHLHSITRLFKELDGHLAYFRRRVVQLSQKKPQAPRHWAEGIPDELAKMTGRK